MPKNIVIGSHVHRGDPELVWIDGQIINVNGDPFNILFNYSFLVIVLSATNNIWSFSKKKKKKTTFDGCSNTVGRTIQLSIYVVLETWLTETWVLDSMVFAELWLHLNIGLDKGIRPIVLSADSVAVFFEAY